MQPKAALRNGQPAPAQARSGWIMPFVFRTAGPSSQLIWTAVLRNLKLRMSRKLIFVSGLLTCFSCLHDPSSTLSELKIGAGQPVEPLVNHLKRYVNSTPLDIVARSLLVYGAPDTTSEKLFRSYDSFLAALDDPDIRGRLMDLKSDHAESSPVFQDMREISHGFQDALTEFFFESNKEFFELIRRYGVF